MKIGIEAQDWEKPTYPVVGTRIFVPLIADNQRSSGTKHWTVKIHAWEHMIVDKFHNTHMHHPNDHFEKRVKNEQKKANTQQHLARTVVSTNLPGQAADGWIVEDPDSTGLWLTISAMTGSGSSGLPAGGLHVVEWDDGTNVRSGAFYVAAQLERKDILLPVHGDRGGVDLSASSIGVSSNGTMMANTAWFVVGNSGGDSKEPMGWSVVAGPSPITYVTVSFAGNGPISGDYSVSYNTGVWAGTGWAKLTGGFNVA